jgi:class 3 adenylate cyclase
MSTTVMRSRRSLFMKYFLTLFVAVVVPLMFAAVGEAWFGYKDQRLRLNDVLQAEARSAAGKIQAFTDGIGDQLGWVVQFPWTEAEDNRHRIDALRLLEQVPAIVSATLVDQSGQERVFASRLQLNRMGRGIDMSTDPAILGARADKVWYGRVRYQHDSEPYMRIAVAGNLPAAGVAVAYVNLKMLWDVIAAIKIGNTGYIVVVDESGRLIAHPDMSLVLRGSASSDDFVRLTHALKTTNGSAVVTTADAGKTVVAVSVNVGRPNWNAIAVQPTAEALSPIRAALWRSLVLIAISTLITLLLAYWLANRMSGPVRQLEDGAKRIGAGQFDYRIAISSGDELEQLATSFNEMAKELTTSRQKSERINRLKRFLAPQVADLVEHSDDLLGGHRREIVAIFGDLRGFTSFSARAEPDAVMAVLTEYYEAVGAVITRHEATLTQFAGDGVMILVNAPIERENPTYHAVLLAIDLQMAVQRLASSWSARGYTMGFGVGIAMGPAIVGTIGYEGRLDYTAVGNIVNLASRLCASADDTQILVDPVVAQRAKDNFVLVSLGERAIKGYDRALEVFAVVRSEVTAEIFQYQNIVVQPQLA